MDRRHPGGLTYTSCGDANSFNTSHTLLNEPADIAVDPNPDPVTHTPGSVYIADGYGNHRVVVYTTSDGGKTYQYNRQWGTTCKVQPPLIMLVKTAPQAHSAQLEAATRIASFSAMTDLSTCVTGRIAASRFSTRVVADHQYQEARRPADLCAHAYHQHRD